MLRSDKIICYECLWLARVILFQQVQSIICQSDAANTLVLLQLLFLYFCFSLRGRIKIKKKKREKKAGDQAALKRANQKFKLPLKNKVQEKLSWAQAIYSWLMWFYSENLQVVLFICLSFARESTRSSMYDRS